MNSGKRCRRQPADSGPRQASAWLSRSSLMMASRAAITSSRSTRDLVNRSCSLNALVGAR